MPEAQSILELAQRARQQGRQLCLATVVHVEGSAYRKPGARMLMTSGGERAGTISGGCLEAEVSRKAWWLTAEGARVERYSSFADEDGGMPYGLGCGGTVSLLVERGEAAEAVLAAMERVGSTRRPAVILASLGNTRGGERAATDDLDRTRSDAAGTIAVLASASGQLLASRTRPELQGKSLAQENEVQILYQRAAPRMALDDALLQAAAAALAQQRSLYLTATAEPCAGGQDRQSATAEPMSLPAYYVEYLAPPPAITIFGAGDDAQPMAALAHALGWRVTVADGRAHLARHDRFPTAAKVQVLDYAGLSPRPACGTALAADQPPGQLSGPGLHQVSAFGIEQLPGALLASAARFPELPCDEIAVILTHSYEQDRAVLATLLPRSLLYLGILGPRHRTERLLAEVAPQQGLSIGEGFARLRSPIGLDLGAEDPAAVALSVIAEIQAVLHGRSIEVKRRNEMDDAASANGGNESLPRRHDAETPERPVEVIADVPGRSPIEAAATREPAGRQLA